MIDTDKVDTDLKDFSLAVILEKDIAERIAEIFERDYANSYLRGDEVARIIRGRMK